MYCKYYKAKSLKSKTWFVFGAIRNEENVAFGRTLDKKESILEFFVAPDYEQHFIKIMKYLKNKGYILELKKEINRLAS
ncbi:hypothetical protein GF385_02410 [Candidatus Dependentiae bacterium]|nr:hypothetical protein [Candidatus Dependentiae bacterium]